MRTKLFLTLCLVFAFSLSTLLAAEVVDQWTRPIIRDGEAAIASYEKLRNTALSKSGVVSEKYKEAELNYGLALLLNERYEDALESFNKLKDDSKFKSDVSQAKLEYGLVVSNYYSSKYTEAIAAGEAFYKKWEKNMKNIEEDYFKVLEILSSAYFANKMQDKNIAISELVSKLEKKVIGAAARSALIVHLVRVYGNLKFSDARELKKSIENTVTLVVKKKVSLGVIWDNVNIPMIASSGGLKSKFIESLLEYVKDKYGVNSIEYYTGITTLLDTECALGEQLSFISKYMEEAKALTVKRYGGKKGGSFDYNTEMVRILALYVKYNDYTNANAIIKEIEPLILELEGEASVNNAILLMAKGDMFTADKNYETAVKMYLRAISIMKSRSDASDKDKMRAWEYIGLSYLKQGNEKLAQKYYDEALNYKKKIYGERTVQFIELILKYGDLALEYKVDKTAEYFYLKAKVIYTKAGKKKPQGFASLLVRLVDFYGFRGDIVNTIDYARKFSEEIKTGKNVETYEKQEGFIKLSKILYNLCAFDEAYDVALNSVEYNVDNFELKCITIEGLLRRDILQKAFEVLADAATQVQANYGESSWQYAVILMNYGRYYTSIGNFENAGQSFSKAVALLTNIPKYDIYTRSLLEFAQHNINIGVLDEALSAINMADKIIRDNSDKIITKYPSILVKKLLGIYNKEVGQLEQSIASYQAAIAVDSTGWSTSEDYANTITSLGAALIERNKNDDRTKGVALLDEATKIFTPRGIKSPLVANLYYTLYQTYKGGTEEEKVKAMSSLMAAYTIYVDRKIEKDKLFVSILQALGVESIKAKDFAKATEYLQKGISVGESIAGSRFYNLGDIYLDLAKAYGVKKKKNALTALNKGLTLVKNNRGAGSKDYLKALKKGLNIAKLIKDNKKAGVITKEIKALEKKLKSKSAAKKKKK